jgi:hypothetical protein
MATNRNPVLIIIFSIITCGIYYLYWVWVTNAELNRLAGRENVGGGMVILSYFCGFVGWYIWYKWDKSLIEMTRERQVTYSNSNFILWLVLTFLGIGPWIMMFQVQDTINSLNGASI